MCQGKATAIIQSRGMSKYLCTLACGAISGERNGCPRRDPRQNIAGLYAFRKGEEFGRKSESDTVAKTLVDW
jgi:hypothetical protein